MLSGLMYPDGSFRSRQEILADPFSPSPQEEGETDWKSFIREAIKRQEFREQNEVSKAFEIAIDTPADTWQAIAFSGDWHLFAEGTDHAAWAYDMSIILDTPDMRLAMMGDEGDMFHWRPGTFEQVGPPQTQVDAVNTFVRDVLENDSMLFRVGGNHTEEWMFKQLGLEYAKVVWGLDGYVPYLREGGLIHWRCGDIDYKIIAAHRMFYNSSLNMFHSNRRRFRMEGPADVVAKGHTHELGTSDEWLAANGRPYHSHMVCSGSYKRKDRYARGKGLPPQQIGASVVCFNPKEKETWSVTGIERGRRLLDMLQWEMNKNRNLSVGNIIKELSKV